MISDADIYRSAQVLIREHGDDAKATAQSRANAFWDKGDDDGAAVWMRIAGAIEELQKTSPGTTDRSH
jgi:hypothetical protein